MKTTQQQGKGNRKEKVYAFIDSQNLNLGTRANKWKLDYKKFRTYLKTKYNVEKAFLFIGFIAENQSLYTNLQEMGYLLVFKNVMQIMKDGKKTFKGNVDAELVLHAMTELKNYDKAVIVSGDGDFYCLIEYLDNEKKLGKIIVPNFVYSSLLKKYASKILMLGSVKNKLQYVERKTKKSQEEKTSRTADINTKKI